MSFVDAADETAEDVVPIEGTVKWFDPANMCWSNSGVGRKG